MKRPAFPRLTAALFRRRDRAAARVARALARPLIEEPPQAWPAQFRTEAEWRAWCRQDEQDEATEMAWSEIGR